MELLKTYRHHYLRLFKILIIIPAILFILTSCFSRVDFYDIASSEHFTILDVYASSNRSIRICFSSVTEATSAESIDSYSIPGLELIDVIRDPTDFCAVQLLSFPQEDIDYTLTVTGLKDADGLSLEKEDSRVFRGDSCPGLKSVVPHSNTEVVVYFSEDVEKYSAENHGYYNISDLTVLSAERDSTDQTKVTLTTSSQGDGTSYTLTVTDVMDLTFNSIASPNSMDFLGIGLTDTTSPTVLWAERVDGNTVEVQFSEPVEETSSETMDNYHIEDAGGNPESVTGVVRQVDISKVWLDIDGTFSESLYYLTVSTDVEDLSGNPLVGPPDNTTSFAGEDTSISSATATSNTTVRVFFSSDAELTGAQTVGNYSIPGLALTTATRDAIDFSIVDLDTFAQEDINYTLTVTGVITEDTAVFGGDVAPYIQNASSYSNTEVVIYFSEPVEITQAQESINYSIPGLAVISAARDTADHSKVVLDTGSQGDGTNYTLTIDNVRDLNGNTIESPNSKDFTGSGIVDNTPPSVLSAVLIDDNTVEVRFSEPVAASSSENTSNYTIKDNSDNPVPAGAATRQSDESKVWLDIGGSFSENLYVVAVSTSVTDISFNPLKDAPYNTVSFVGMGTPPETFGDGPVIVDPIGEGSNNFSMLARYRGRIYIGPSGADNAVFRLKPDGSDPEIVSFIFHGDGSDTTSLSPGPDGEEGINYICGGEISGPEYLFIGPFKTPDLSEIGYIYYTTDNGNIIEFDYMDISPYVSLYTKSVSSMTIFNNNLYVGYPNRYPWAGREKPCFTKFQSVSPVIGSYLKAYLMPRIGNPDGGNTAEKVGIDSMAVYKDKLYIANGGGSAIGGDGGILRSTNNNPGDYQSSPGDWEDVTPVGDVEWYSLSSDRFSIELSKVERLIPADKAFPAMTVFNDRLYVARNTVHGPQLWKYDDSSWTLVAENGSGLTNMSDAGNSHVTLLVVNGDRLYVGYDNNISGIQIWRTDPGVIDPGDEADFEPVSIDGLGDPINNQRIYHGISIADGGTDYLWVLCGKDTGRIRVYRTSN